MEEVGEDEEGSATRTRARAATRTITQEVLLQMTDVSGNGRAIMAKSAASRKFSMQFLCDYANAVLDGKTGELLEYRHLIARPKYKQAWGASFGNEIGRLAQGMPGRVKGTDTMFFVDKSRVPNDRCLRQWQGNPGKKCSLKKIPHAILL